ncbi:hypothetical protein [Stutzerimonas nitrititolerans]|uniref:hypothetical protein n=1 Tax=Stutzerimonas nitrititolerans TaxID=2482751 RepID=UPI0028A997CA|nr:hypothetical protein [Stutzerimonas nitrititolerans]
MSDEANGLADGESQIDPSAFGRYIERQIWKHEWERRLARLALCLVIGFYVLLVGFIFLGNGRIVVGLWYIVVSFKPHGVADVPIILALASIPTILMIALLRYFHHNGGSDSKGESLLPLSAQAAKDVSDLFKN